MPLRDLFDLGARELVSFVGGGGKTALLMRLGGELAAEGRRVLLTTTTKMGADEVRALPSVCRQLAEVETSLNGPGPVLLITGEEAGKVTGPDPIRVDELFEDASVDYLLVEADGAAGRPLKAPGRDEPVIPSTSTLVVVMMGMDAVGRRVDEAAHRPEQAMRLTGGSPDHRLTAEDCAAVIGHPDGGLKGVPPGARVVVALTKVQPGPTQRAAREIARRLTGHERIDAIAEIPAG